jgi:hypothetical protein
MSRMYFIFAACLCLVAFGPANACTLNEIQKSEMRDGFCGQEIGVAPGLGCTDLIMRLQVADQFKQIALARRCGYQAEADKLDYYYKLTTPFVVKLYECVDLPMDRADIERKAKEDTDKNMSSLPQGCPENLKSQLAKNLPGLISTDEKSLRDIKKVATQIGLDAK